ncbi:MAG: hypothetical protein MZV65_29085 [Chromatiales bacterium]|nr:hypothetical protein [Chromatiales bacterium]
MKIAVAGRPGAGKSALFELLARLRGRPGGAPPRPARPRLRIAHVEVPDPRVAELSASYRPRKTTPGAPRLRGPGAEVGAHLPGPRRNAARCWRRPASSCSSSGCTRDAPETWEAESVRQWREAMDEFHIYRPGRRGVAPGEAGEDDPDRSEDRFSRGIRAPAATAHAPRSRPPGAHPSAVQRRRSGACAASLLSGRPLLPAFNISEDHLARAESHQEKLLHALDLADPEEAAHPCVLFSAEVEKQILELPPEEQASFLQASGLDHAPRSSRRSEPLTSWPVLSASSPSGRTRSGPGPSAGGERRRRRPG